MEATIAMPGVASVNVAPLPGQNGGTNGAEVAIPTSTEAAMPEPIPLPGSKQLVHMEEQVRQETRPPEQFNPDQARDKIARYLEQMNRFAETLKLGMRFGIYEDSNQMYLQLVDTRTDRVVKTVPMEKLLALRVKLEDFAGLFVDEKA